MKSPITLLEDLQSNLRTSPLEHLSTIVEDLESAKLGVYDIIATYERRLAARDEEIKDLERQIPNDVFFNRLSDEYSQLEFVAEHTIKEVA